MRRNLVDRVFRVHRMASLTAKGGRLAVVIDGVDSDARRAEEKPSPDHGQDHEAPLSFEPFAQSAEYLSYFHVPAFN